MISLRNARIVSARAHDPPKFSAQAESDQLARWHDLAIDLVVELVSELADRHLAVILVRGVACSSTARMRSTKIAVAKALAEVCTCCVYA